MAKKASLWTKPGPWQQYPDRMLQMRARGFALRDTFADVLRGLISREEAEDMPSPPPPTIEGRAEPPDSPPQPPQPPQSPSPPATRAAAVAEWMRARLIELGEAQSEAAISALVDANAKAVKRLTPAEHKAFHDAVMTATARVKEARGEGAFDPAEPLLDLVASYDLVTLSRLHEDKWWREAYNNLDEDGQERVADAVEERKRALKAGRGDASSPGPQA